MVERLNVKVCARFKRHVRFSHTSRDNFNMMPWVWNRLRSHKLRAQTDTERFFVPWNLKTTWTWQTHTMTFRIIAFHGESLLVFQKSSVAKRPLCMSRDGFQTVALLFHGTHAGFTETIQKHNISFDGNSMDFLKTTRVLIRRVCHFKSCIVYSSKFYAFQKHVVWKQHGVSYKNAPFAPKKVTLKTCECWQRKQALVSRSNTFECFHKCHAAVKRNCAALEWTTTLLFQKVCVLFKLARMLYRKRRVCVKQCRQSQVQMCLQKTL